MAKNKFRLVKIFDCQDMPRNVRDAFFERTEGKGNDCYVNHYWDEEDDNDAKIVDSWLLENGAKKNEDILINHWW